MDTQQNIFNGAKSLMVKSFPYLTEGNIDAIIGLAVKNDGILFPPIDEPDFLFAFWRFWPKLIDIVEHCEWADLERQDLTTGPILYIAAFIMPGKAYSCVRELIYILNPFAVCCHRYKDQEFTFHFKRNMQFSRERFEETNGPG